MDGDDVRGELIRVRITLVSEETKTVATLTFTTCDVVIGSCTAPTCIKEMDMEMPVR